MNKYLNKLISKGLKTLPYSFLANLTDKKIILPVYHLVSDSKVPHIANLYAYKNINAFKRDIDFFLKHYKPITLSDFISYVRKEKEISKKSFLLTFDDGYREVHDIIAPILSEKSVPAVFFLNTAFIDNKEMFFRNKTSLIIDAIHKFKAGDETEKLGQYLKDKGKFNVDIETSLRQIDYSETGILNEAALIMKIDIGFYLRENKPYLSHEEVKTLINKGFDIGSHSIDHPLFGKLPLNEQLRQVHDSLSELKSSYSIRHNVFAFPFNESGVSSEFYEQTHFNGGIDLSFGTFDFNKGNCENNFQRQSMERFNYSAKEIYSTLLRKGILENFHN